MQSSPIRKLYLSINDVGIEKRGTRHLLYTAVGSCLAKTDLEVNLLYVGRKNEFTAHLEAKSVKVHYHDPAFAEVLRKGYKDEYEIFKGHWLRVDIPLIEKEDDFVLYTDIDVLFHDGFTIPTVRPDFIAAAPEHEKNNFGYFNSGVMVVNVVGLRENHAAFGDALRRRVEGGFTYPAHDQASFNEFFKGRWQLLPNEFNWKPYWGVNKEAKIIHFHGTKPGHAEKILAEGAKAATSWEKIVARDPEAYRYYCDVWKAEREKAMRLLK